MYLGQGRRACKALSKNSNLSILTSSCSLTHWVNTASQQDLKWCVYATYVETFRYWLTENCHMVITLYFLADSFLFFLHYLSESHVHLWALSLPNSSWPCRTNSTATSEFPLPPLPPNPASVLRGAGRVREHCLHLGRSPLLLQAI